MNKAVNNSKHLKLDQLYVEYRIKLTLIESWMNKLMFTKDLRARESVKVTINQLSQALELYECAIYGFNLKRLMLHEIEAEEFQHELDKSRLMVLGIRDQFAHTQKEDKEDKNS